MKNSLRKLSLVSFLFVGNVTTVTAEVAFTEALPNPAQSGKPVVLKGSADCAQVYLITGDPRDHGGQMVSVDNVSHTFELSHVYSNSGLYAAEVFQISSGGCVTTDIDSGNNALRITVVEAKSRTQQNAAPSAITPFANSPLALAIEQVELFFESGSAKIRVAPDQRDLILNARIRYRGTGVLQAVWEVDGRRYATVTEYLDYGNDVVLSTPNGPYLPTSIVGPHRVEFRIVSPQFGTAAATAFYFVDPNRVQTSPITILGPETDSTLNDVETEFRWSGKHGARYRLDFYDTDPATSGHETPTFSAYSNTVSYTLSEETVDNYFVPDQTYWWQVSESTSGARQTIIPTSGGKIKVPKKPTRVPGQIIIATDLAFSAAAIVKNFALREIATHEIETLKLRLSVYETNQDVPTLLAELSRLSDIKIAQPNSLFHTSGEPLASMQKIVKRLRLGDVHNFTTGKDTRIAVIDSAVDSRHRDLSGRVAIRRNFISDDDNEGEIHGTAVAGVIAASINNFGIIGIAPDAKILALRACRQKRATAAEAICDTVSVSRALDFALTQGAQVVNMSFGTPDSDRVIELLLVEGERRGVVFVAPVGNLRTQRDANFPARDPLVIAVGGEDDTGAPYPNAALVAQARVVAPATQIFTTIPGNRHNFLDGSSFAAAIISGVIGLAIETQAAGKRIVIPTYQGDLCAWEAALLNKEVCP